MATRHSQRTSGSAVILREVKSCAAYIWQCARSTWQTEWCKFYTLLVSSCWKCDVVVVKLTPAIDFHALGNSVNILGFRQWPPNLRPCCNGGRNLSFVFSGKEMLQVSFRSTFSGKIDVLQAFLSDGGLMSRLFFSR